MPEPRIGLALGSGAARGWAHIGVLRALTEAGLQPALIAGTSVGALVGGVHLAGKLDVLEDWARDLTKLKIVRYLDFQLRRGGMIAGNRLLSIMEEHLADLPIEQLPLPFACVATDLASGHEVWLQRGRLIDALRASISLPGLLAPVRADGRWLVDGALVNPLPVSVCRAMGADIIIAVNLSSDHIGRSRVIGGAPRAARVDLMQAGPKGESRARRDAVARQIFGRAPGAPSLFGVMVQSLNIIQDRITRSRLAGEPPDISINPRLGHIGLLEFDRADEVIAEGEAAATRALPELREAIGILGPAER